MDIDELISSLEKASYKTDGGNTWQLISGSRERDLLKTIVHEWAGKQNESPNKARIAELEAKVYAYEAIIANSNFAPVIGKETPKEKITIHLNDMIKVRLTERGKDLYYHRHDDLIEAGVFKEDQREMPAVDYEGKTEFQLWDFISLYGQHIGLGIESIIQPMIIEKVGE